MYNIVCLATASTEVEEFVQNPGVVKTYLDKYTPAVIGFLVQIIVAIIVLLVGIKIIKSVVKVIKKGFDRSHIDDGVGTFLTSLIKYALYFIGIYFVIIDRVRTECAITEVLSWIYAKYTAMICSYPDIVETVLGDGIYAM